MNLKLIDKKKETPDVITFIFKPEETLVWKAGQFLHYVLHHEPTDDRGSDRWFTVSSAPFEKNIHITTRITSEKGSSFKNSLNSLKIDEDIEISNLEGKFTLDDPDKNYIFVAGGIGITPFRSIIKELDFEKKSINITLLYANKDKNIVFKEELEEISKRNPNFKIHYVFSPEHIDENKIQSLIPDFKEKIIYVSGPEQMVDSVFETLKKMGTPETNLKGDWFPGYQGI